MKISFFLFILFSASLTFGQEAENEIEHYPRQLKHQIGIGASQFVKVIFESDLNEYSLNYRFKKNETTSLRAGISYNSDSSENGSTEGGLSIGFDKNLKLFKKWEFYYGVDLLTRYERFKGSNKEIIKIGAGPMLGISYYISPNFSLAIEPLLLFEYNLFLDHNSFTNKKTETYKLGLRKIGLINLNFHF